jgi:hypothetical protein
VKVFYDPVIAKLIPVAATTPPLRPDWGLVKVI